MIVLQEDECNREIPGQAWNDRLGSPAVGSDSIIGGEILFMPSNPKFAERRDVD
jgi:hypothetical protein